MKKIIIFLTSALCVLFANTLHSQITKLDNVATSNPEFVGWDNTGFSKPLDIMNNSSTPDNIDFYINSNKFLQVLTGGDLNTIVGTNGYMINNNYVLRHNGIIQNIYLGVGAGNVNNTHSNTFVGYNTGLNNGNSALLLRHGSRNTFVGHLAGMTNDMGEENTFVGDSCGYNT